MKSYFRTENSTVSPNVTESYTSRYLTLHNKIHLESGSGTDGVSLTHAALKVRNRKSRSKPRPLRQSFQRPLSTSAVVSSARVAGSEVAEGERSVGRTILGVVVDSARRGERSDDDGSRGSERIIV